MKLIRKTFSLLAWLFLYVPTTLFVVLVMIKASLEQRREQEEELT
jgi:hypothetical protein